MTLTYLRGHRGALIGALFLAAGALLPFVVYPVFAIDLICFGLAAVALDLLLGFTGLLSFGHALFWGGSAYVATILVAQRGAPVLAALVVAVAYAALLALIVGALAIRRSGIYFAMITLGIAEVQYFLAFQLVDLTGGENGTQISSRGSLFGIPLDDDRAFYFVALALVAMGTAFALRVVASPFGAVLTAMRENEQRARSIGYDTDRFKLATFVMSGALAGLAGALFGIGNKLSGLDGVDWHTSGALVMMTILGGMGTIYGPMLGAVVFQALDYFVSKTPIGDKTNLVMGLIFAVVILLARRGIVGEILWRISVKSPIDRDANR